MTRQQKHVKARRERGLCAEEGCEVVTGDTYRCPPHAEAHAKECRDKRYWDRPKKRAA